MEVTHTTLRLCFLNNHPRVRADCNANTSLFIEYLAMRVELSLKAENVFKLRQVEPTLKVFTL